MATTHLSGAVRPANPARRAPRVICPQTNMSRAAAVAANQVPASKSDGLRIFNTIPDNWHGVIAVEGDGAAPLLRKGEVAVYEKYAPHIHGLVDGGLYVIEYQTPRSGMSREMFAKFFTDHYASRLDVSRRIVRVERFRGDWKVTSIEGAPQIAGVAGFVVSDWPYDDIRLNNALIGVVVGIYRNADAAIGGVA